MGKRNSPRSVISSYLKPFPRPEPRETRHAEQLDSHKRYMPLLLFKVIQSITPKNGCLSPRQHLKGAFLVPRTPRRPLVHYSIVLFFRVPFGPHERSIHCAPRLGAEGGV